MRDPTDTGALVHNLKVVGHHDLAGRLAFVNDEAMNEDGNERLNLAGIVDVADIAAPTLISVFRQPLPPQSSPGPPGPDDLAYLTYFNAGLRVYDVSDARSPTEIAWFLPPDPQATTGTKPTKPVAQSEDVLVDRRGYIYVSHKSQGIWILRLGEEPSDG